MDIIETIKNTIGYDFEQLYDLVPFDKLHDYINIYSASLNLYLEPFNLILWSIFNNHHKTSDLINMYMDYFDKFGINENNLLINNVCSLDTKKNIDLILLFIDKCGYNYSKMQYFKILFDFRQGIFLESKLIFKFGILFQVYKRYTTIYQYFGMHIYSYLRCDDYKLLMIFIDYYGILLENIKYVDIKKDTDIYRKIDISISSNKLILIYGKY